MVWWHRAFVYFKWNIGYGPYQCIGNTNKQLLSEDKMFLEFYVDCTFVVFEDWSTLCCHFTLIQGLHTTARGPNAARETISSGPESILSMKKNIVSKNLLIQ